MQNSRDRRNKITMVGAILFLLLLVALGLWFYGQVLSKTNSGVLMVCATVAKKSAALVVCATIMASVLSIGRYLLLGKAESDKQGEAVKKDMVDSREAGVRMKPAGLKANI